jgi:hypothetical protein|eukprot:TRINITY_DN56758_c0_g1_i1.p1 TRINITY_DN56758_c0_g1~~TRINITY_DN56758_c0_g1_i1.p1  ORF type:complete len:365 (+),score=78.10 TRINITY_DN56758_c0_g1_i1:143-1237(+)
MRLLVTSVLASVFNLHQATFLSEDDGFLSEDDASLTSASAPLKVREAALAAKTILDEPLNKQRLEAMSKTIRYTAPGRHQRTLLLTAAHHIIGDKLDKYGISQENMGIVFRELHHLSHTDPEIARWIQQLASLVQSESSNVALLSGAAALQLTRSAAALALDKFIDIVTAKENAQQLRAAVQDAAFASDPPKFLLSAVRDMVGDKLVQYGITNDNFLPTFAHLRSWSMEDSQLKPRMEKLMQAFENDEPKQQVELPENAKHPHSVLDVQSDSSTFSAKATLEETLGTLSVPGNKSKFEKAWMFANSTDMTPLAARLLEASRDALVKRSFEEHGSASEIASQIDSAAAHDPKMVSEIMSVIDLVG